jgi:hypothetical protein
MSRRRLFAPMASSVSATACSGCRRARWPTDSARRSAPGTNHRASARLGGRAVVPVPGVAWQPSRRSNMTGRRERG